MTFLAFMAVCIFLTLTSQGQRPEKHVVSTSELTHIESRQRRDLIPSHFKHLYVHANGSITDRSFDRKVTIEVGGSPLTSNMAVQAAAELVAAMTRHMMPEVFHRLASGGSAVGVFTRAEKLIVFPTFAHFSNAGCSTSCWGNCSHTCTPDHRKIENLSGLGGNLAVVLDDNLLCTSRDPYRHGESILAHEFSHTTQSHGLTPWLRQRVHQAYVHAKANHTWDVLSYAMNNDREYFAEAVTVFLGVCHHSRKNSGGMNRCHGYSGPLCATEAEGRQRLKVKDPMLYNVLVRVFSSDHPDMMHGLTVCPKPTLHTTHASLPVVG